MKRLPGYAMILGLAMLLPIAAEAQKKTAKPVLDDTARATPQDFAQLNQLREIVGKLTAADVGSKSLTIRLESQTMKPNPNFRPDKNPANNQLNSLYQSYQRLLVDQQRAMQTVNPNQRLQAMERAQRDMQQLMKRWYQMQSQAANPKNQNGANQPYMVVTTGKDFELDVQDTVVTRRLVLPVDYDDKGNLKEYTKEELAKVRGKDASKPGYSAKYEDVTIGQVVKLYLTPAKPPTPAKKADKDDKTDEPAPPIKPTVRMVLIQEETPAPSLAPAKGKKKQ